MNHQIVISMLVIFSTVTLASPKNGTYSYDNKYGTGEIVIKTNSQNISHFQLFIVGAGPAYNQGDISGEITFNKNTAVFKKN